MLLVLGQTLNAKQRAGIALIVQTDELKRMLVSGTRIQSIEKVIIIYCLTATTKHSIFKDYNINEILCS